MQRADGRRIAARVVCAVALLAAASPAIAQGASDAALLKDLTSAIAVLGLPCGEVVSATRRAEHDHIASCKDGSRYRVFINAQGRVTAQKQ